MQQAFAFKKTGLPRLPIDAKFQAFHEANPHVYARIVELATELRNAGRTRISMETIFGRMRWDDAIQTDATDFRISDHYTSRFARKLIAEHPEFDGFFELRELRS